MICTLHLQEHSELLCRASCPCGWESRLPCPCTALGPNWSLPLAPMTPGRRRKLPWAPAVHSVTPTSCMHRPASCTQVTRDNVEEPSSEGGVCIACKRTGGAGEGLDLLSSSCFSGFWLRVNVGLCEKARSTPVTLVSFSLSL